MVSLWLDFLVKSRLNCRAMSDLKTWLSQERGRAKALAARLGVSKSRMSQMVSGGVPREHLIAVRDFTNGEVSLEALLTQPQHSQSHREVAHG